MTAVFCIKITTRQSIIVSTVGFVLVRVVGLEPTRLTAEEPKSDVTLVKGLKPPECFIIALQNTYQQSEFSGIN